MPPTLITYLYINFISCSTLFNTLLGGLPYQTFSARNWQWKKDGYWNLVWLVDYSSRGVEEDHCMNCWVRWKIGRHAVNAYQKEEYYERYRPSNIDGL